MLGLWSLGSAPMGMRLHVAFTVDLEELQHAIDGLVGAHEALRTGIRLEGDALHQEIGSQARLTLQVVPALSIDEELARPFDLSHPPLLRATYATETRTLLLVAHHSIVDRPSLRLMFRALTEGVATPELHYIDHSEWLRAIPESEIQELFLHWQY